MFGITNFLPLEGPAQREFTNRLRYPASYQLREPKFIKTQVKCYKQVVTRRAADKSSYCWFVTINIKPFCQTVISSCTRTHQLKPKNPVAQSSRTFTVFQPLLFLISLSLSSNSILVVQEQVTPISGKY